MQDEGRRWVAIGSRFVRGDGLIGDDAENLVVSQIMYTKDQINNSKSTDQCIVRMALALSLRQEFGLTFTMNELCQYREITIFSTNARLRSLLGTSPSQWMLNGPNV